MSTGNVKLKEGVEMVMPGDNVEIEVELIQPIAMEKQIRFAIREGGKTVGAGRVTENYRVIPTQDESRQTVGFRRAVNENGLRRSGGFGVK